MLRIFGSEGFLVIMFIVNGMRKRMSMTSPHYGNTLLV